MARMAVAIMMLARMVVIKRLAITILIPMARMATT